MFLFSQNIFPNTILMNHFTFRIRRKPEKLHDSSEYEENSDLGIDGVCILPPSPSYQSRSDSRYRAFGNPISAPPINRQFIN